MLDSVQMESPSLRLGLEMNDYIPVPGITPTKWAAMEPTCSYQKKGLSSINTSTLDEDSGLGMDADQEFTLATIQHEGMLTCEENMEDSLIEFQRRRPAKKGLQVSSTRRCLFNNKRSRYEDENVSSASKRLRGESFSQMSASWTTSANLSPSLDPTSAILDAVNRMTFESDLIADGSRTYCLPTVPSNHKDLKCITADTMAAVIREDSAGVIKICTIIIDCRFPYEFEGGHIKGALNLYTKEMMQQFLHQTLEETHDSQRRILIFHCEFSSERGPKMYRFLREQDRILNKDKYPHLCYPEVYLLEGGYKAFYETYKHYCEPTDYKPMLHKDHTAELRHFKAKSKSWSAGDKKQRHLCQKLVF